MTFPNAEGVRGRRCSWGKVQGTRHGEKQRPELQHEGAEDGGDPCPALSLSLIKLPWGRDLCWSWLGHAGGLRSLPLTHVTGVSTAAGNRTAFAAHISGFLAVVSRRAASVRETHGGSWQLLRYPSPTQSHGWRKIPWSPNSGKGTSLPSYP